MDLGLPPLEILTMKEEKRKKERMCVCCPSRVGSLEGTPYFGRSMNLSWALSTGYYLRLYDYVVSQ